MLGIFPAATAALRAAVHAGGVNEGSGVLPGGGNEADHSKE